MAKQVSRIFGPECFRPRQLPLRRLEKPRASEVHLWHLDFDRLSSPLNPVDGTDNRAWSFAQRRAVRRFYLRLLLGAYLDLPGKDVKIQRRMKGRPEIDAAQSRGELDFSVARSNSCYLIGVSSGAPVGVDLEIANRKAGRPLAVARRYFSTEETAALASMDEVRLRRAFMHTWACKEAIVKAHGLGIANQLCRFTVDVDPDRPPAVLHMQDDDHAAWRLAIAAPESRSVAAVAVRQQGIRLKGFNLT